MKVGLPLKLGICVVVLFTILIAGMVVLRSSFKWYIADLDSENPETRWKAFKYLNGRGPNGTYAIENFCRRHNNAGWGKRFGDIRVKLIPDEYIYYCEKSDNSVPVLSTVHFKIEVQNLGDNNIDLLVNARGLTIEAVNVNIFISNPNARDSPGFGGKFGGPIPGPVDVESGKIISGLLPYYLPRRFGFDQPGIYIIQLEYNSTPPRRFGDLRGLMTARPNALSNKICIAVLPPRKK